MDTEVDDIGADIMKAMQGEAEPAALETDILPPDTQADAEQPEAVTGERVRDEHGRFAKAEEVVQTAPQAQQQEPAKPTILPPKSWTPQAKADFATLAPHVQQEILRREGEIDAGKQQWETKAEQFNKLDAALSKVRDRYRLAGLSDDQYVGALVQADEMLRGPNALQAIHMLAQQYGINLGQQPQGGPQQQFQPADPQTQILQQYLTPLQQEVQQLRQQLDQQKQSSEQAQLSEAAAAIEAFRNDPANIYFDNVKDDIVALLKAGRATDLADAYDKAIWANKDIRTILQATGHKPTTTQTKPASPQVTGAQRGAAPRPSDASNSNSIEDDVREAMSQLAGRV